MNKTANKISLYAMDKLAEQGMLRVVTCPCTGLRLYGYSKECEKTKLWNEHTLLCRSLIVEPDGEGMAKIVCKTFTKFFNLGQRPETQPDALPNEKFVATEKLDGSFIQIFYYKGEWRISSKGSFDNTYVDHARKYLPPDMDIVPVNMVFACEVVLPPEEDEMRRVVQHEPGLYLLAAFKAYNNFEEFDINVAQTVWKAAGGQCAKVHFESVKELISMRIRNKTTEGWVIRYDSGLRIKVKTLWWVGLTRFANELNDDAIKSFILGNWNFSEGDDIWLSIFPPEYQIEARKIAADIWLRYTNEYDRIVERFAELNCPVRKDFAFKAKDDPNSWALFRLYDRKDFAQELMEKI